MRTRTTKKHIEDQAMWEQLFLSKCRRDDMLQTLSLGLTQLNARMCAFTRRSGAISRNPNMHEKKRKDKMHEDCRIEDLWR